MGSPGLFRDHGVWSLDLRAHQKRGCLSLRHRFGTFICHRCSIWPGITKISWKIKFCLKFSLKNYEIGLISRLSDEATDLVSTPEGILVVVSTG